MVNIRANTRSLATVRYEQHDCAAGVRQPVLDQALDYGDSELWLIFVIQCQKWVRSSEAGHPFVTE